MSSKNKHKATPPRLATHFLHWYCRAELVDEVEGDLYELFQRRVEEEGFWKARALYWINILMFLHPDYIRERQHNLHTNQPAMLRNYFLTAWRQVQKSKGHTAINIFGLATGIAACLIIALTVHHEFSYDRHHPDADRIYRITTSLKFADDWIHNGGVSAPIPHAVREEFSGLESITAFHTIHATHVAIPEGATFEEQKGLVLAEPNYFDVFAGYTWVAGNPEQSLNKPYQVVLTESQAQKYFGAKEALGQIVTYFDSLDFVVSGILAEDDHHTDLSFTDFLSFATLHSHQKLAGNYGLESWGSTNSSSLAFVKLPEGTNPQDVEAQFPALLEKNMDKGMGSFERIFHLQPLSDMHFNADYMMDNQRIAHKPTLYGLMLVALFLLLIASINFINLETARAVLRSREVGVRKVLGSSRSQLVQQFMGETFLITLFAGVSAIFLAQLGLDFFAENLPPVISLSLLWQAQGWQWLLLIVVMVSLLAGMYPAWILSAYAPAFALKNQASKAKGGSRKSYLRKSLIIFQFAIAQAFILGTLVVGNQLHYLLNKDMGFQKDAVVHFTIPNWWHDRQDTTHRRENLSNELRKLSSVSALSLSDRLPASTGWSSRMVSHTKDTSEIEVHIYLKHADPEFLDVYRMELLAGRKFMPSDTVNELVINETAAQAFGFDPPAEAVGELIQYNQDKSLPVVGVVKDFHDGPLHEKIHPVVLSSGGNNVSIFNLLLASHGKQVQEVKQSLEQIEELYKQFYPEEPFEYAFYDDTIAGFYKAEQQTARLINVATGLAIFISCLGLLGLVSFTTNQRIKEIGIRKVLGATVPQLITLFSREFIGLVALSFIIAAPLTWYFANEWLSEFAYRSTIGISIFLLTLLSALGLALLTVGLRAWRAALANPVDSLRNE